MNVQIIRTANGDNLVVLTRHDYNSLCASAGIDPDAAEANAIMDRIKAGTEELIPGSVVDRLLDGESPIKVWREHRGLTQAELANAIPMQKNYLSQIECGKRQGSVEMLVKLSKILRVDLDDLIPETRP